MLHTHEPKITSEILMNKNYKSPKIVFRNNCHPTGKCTLTYFEYGVKSRIAEFLEHCMSAYQKVKNMQKRKVYMTLHFK